MLEVDSMIHKTSQGKLWGLLRERRRGWVWGRHRLGLGMRVTTSICYCDHACPQNLLRVGSALLDAANKRHWELIQQTEGGTAWLLQHYEAYASALAQNMRHTYLSPFTIVTPNIGEVVLGWGGGGCREGCGDSLPLFQRATVLRAHLPLLVSDCDHVLF